MSVLISTGSELIQSYFFGHCVACGRQYETTDGKDAYSLNLNDTVKVCNRHDQTLTAAEEALVQKHWQMAIENQRGYILKNGCFLKKSKALADLNEEELKRIVS